MNTLLTFRTKIIKQAEHDGFGWTHLCTGGNQSALLSIVAKCALECAAGVWKWRRSAIDHAKRTRHDAIAAAVTDIVLHEDGANFSTHDRSGRTRFQPTASFPMLPHLAHHNPSEAILV